METMELETRTDETTTGPHVLILEDRAEDAELMIRALRRSGARPTWVRAEDGPGFLAALDGHPDVVLSDYNLPQFNARAALRLLRERSAEVPFIVVSGTLGEAEAAEMLVDGADDYLFKDRLGRLGPAVAHAIRSRRLQDEKRTAERSAADSARQWQATFDAISDPIFLLDCERTIVHCNTAGGQLLDRAPEALGGADALFPGALRVPRPRGVPDAPDGRTRCTARPPKSAPATAGISCRSTRSSTRNTHWPAQCT